MQSSVWKMKYTSSATSGIKKEIISSVSIFIKAGFWATCWSQAFKCQGRKTSATILKKPVFPGLDVLANSLQTQTMQRSEKLQKNPTITSQTLQASACLMLKIVTVTLKKTDQVQLVLEGCQEHVPL